VLCVLVLIVVMSTKKGKTAKNKLTKRNKKTPNAFAQKDIANRGVPRGYNSPSQIVKHVFTVDKSVIGQGSSDALNGIDFSLSDIANYADITAVYDQYKLDFVEFRMDPQYTQCDLNNYSSTLIKPPRVFTVIDYDDANTPGSKAALLQYSTCEVTAPCRSVKREFVPRMAIAAYSGSFTSYANQKAGWIDAASPNVQHYGIKTAIEGGGVSATKLQQYDVTCRYFMSFRAARLT